MGDNSQHVGPGPHPSHLAKSIPVQHTWGGSHLPKPPLQ